MVSIGVYSVGMGIPSRLLIMCK